MVDSWDQEQCWAISHLKVFYHRVISERNCPLCSSGLEFRNHIFFECEYSYRLWQLILELCGIGRIVGSWVQELYRVVSHLKDKIQILI
ncbi:hypothetical protein J1N35_042399 [Gossypium stocksii]|uniref:Reverse transcriptase zinc-binding domain-containing protein n=1 Tax=Gossypium stocksii TaxID=47602 RepID=A0A9D3UH80_9ROSI|nr:hypothetical protein J1N35_042399 [Gossypium stocksii]